MEKDAYPSKRFRIRAREELAIAFQHEIDHLSGILFYDRIDKNDPWKEDELAEVI